MSFDDFASDGDGSPIQSEQLRQMFAESLHWSHKQVKDYQRLQLSQLLLHAKLHAPFYKERLDCVLRRDGGIDWENWERIPIVTRTDLRDRAAEMRANHVPAVHGLVGKSSSSGSTGIPIELLVPQLAITVAGHSWSRLLQMHNVPRDAQLVSFHTLTGSGDPLPRDVMPAEKLPHVTWVRRTLDIDHKLRLLLELELKYLIDVPNHTEVLAYENLRAGSPLHLDRIICIGMEATVEQVDLYARSFGAKTIQPYSSKEGTLMAFRCPIEGRNYHISHELALIEVVDGSGKPVPLGEEGRCIVTPFFNSAQPLIRYDQGDQVMVGAACSCGITLPVLSKIVGRSDSIFHFPGKAFALTRINDVLVRSVLRADAYQFAQVAPSRVVVRYVSADNASQQAMDTVRAHLLGIIQAAVMIDFQRVAQIPFNAGGKQQKITREFDLPTH